MSKSAPPAYLRNKEHGSVYRIIRTTLGYGRVTKGVSGPDLYWIVRGVNPDGSEHRSTSWISVDSWASGQWEAYDRDLLEEK